MLVPISAAWISLGKHVLCLIGQIVQDMIVFSALPRLEIVLFFYSHRFSYEFALEEDYACELSKSLIVNHLSIK